MARHQLHHQVESALDGRVLALVEDADDVRVGEAGGSAGLALEPLSERAVVAQAGVHDLDRALAVEPGVESLVDRRHPATGDPGTDQVAAVEQQPGRRVGERGAARVGARVLLHVDPPAPVGEVTRSGHPTDVGLCFPIPRPPARRTPARS